MHTAPVLHPLSDFKLPSINGSVVDLEHWKNEAMDVIQYVVKNRQSWHFRFQYHQYQYKCIYSKPDTKGCVRIMKQGRMVEFISRAKLNMTLNEISDGLHCGNTYELRSVYAQLYRDACLDGALLKQFQGSQPDDLFHSVAVKWIAFRFSLNKVFHTRDFVFFEYCFTTTDADGRKVLIEYKKSQQFRPDQLHNHDLDISRGDMFVINTYCMEDDQVVMHSQGKFDVSGSFPAWFALTVMPVVFDRMFYHNGLVCAKTLARIGLARISLIKRCSEALAACRVCRNRFKLMRGKKWCRGCGHAVCCDCVVPVVLYKNMIESAPHLSFVREQICTRCLIQARAHRTGVSHKAEIDQSRCRTSIYSEEDSRIYLNHMPAVMPSWTG